MKRRELIKSLFTFIPLGAAFTGITAMGIRFITPSKNESQRRIFTVNLDELTVGSTRKFTDLRGKELMIVRTGEREVKAISSVCTHLGCSVYWQKDKEQFYCPCHLGYFDKDGNVISGPPPRPLDTYQVELEGRNVFIYFNEMED